MYIKGSVMMYLYQKKISVHEIEHYFFLFSPADEREKAVLISCDFVWCFSRNEFKIVLFFVLFFHKDNTLNFSVQGGKV